MVKHSMRFSSASAASPLISGAGGGAGDGAGGFQSDAEDITLV